MKKIFSLICIIILSTLLSGCILSSLPINEAVFIAPGESTNFSIVSFGTKQWYLDDAPIQDATKAQFVFNSTIEDEGKTFSLVAISYNRLFVNFRQWDVVITSNTLPVSEAGPNQMVTTGREISLDGSDSSDADEDPLIYYWEIKSMPQGSTATLSSIDIVNPTFTADTPGTYVIQLIVNDGVIDSEADTIIIIAENSAPVANAGNDQTGYVGGTVHLNGSNSTDVDGDTLSFQWTLTTIPSGSLSALSDSTVFNPTFILDKHDTYMAQLIVYDGTEYSNPDTIIITTGNITPIANAGPDQTVSRSDTVHLDGGGSLDADGDPLIYRWSLTSVPSLSTAIIDDPAVSLPTFEADMLGTYIAQLIVYDGLDYSNPETVTITTENSIPLANAGTYQVVYEMDTVQLDGSGSSDANGDALSYQWSLITQPMDSTTSLNNPTSINPTLYTDAIGDFVLQLIVYDGIHYSIPDTVTITSNACIFTLTEGFESGNEWDDWTLYTEGGTVDAGTTDNNAYSGDNSFVAGPKSGTVGEDGATVDISKTLPSTFVYYIKAFVYEDYDGGDLLCTYGGDGSLKITDINGLEKTAQGPSLSTMSSGWCINPGWVEKVWIINEKITKLTFHCTDIRDTTNLFIDDIEIVTCNGSALP